MEFLSFNAKTKSLKLTKSEIPKVTKNDVLVKVAFSGICGTDLHILKGEFPCKQDGNFTPGHEFVGIVQAIGPEVTTVKVGARVAVDPNSGCNKCNDCHGGNYHHCIIGGINNTIGIQRNGGWATHAVVPEEQVFLLPDDLSLSTAALIEPVSCLSHGLDLTNPIAIGERILIAGAGIIGLLWSSALHHLGHRKTVTISEVQPKRRELAKNLELDYAVKHPSDLKENVDVFDLAVDCSGNAKAISDAISLLGCKGRLCIFGVSKPDAEVPIKPFDVYMKELQIFGVKINPFSFPKGINLVNAMSKRYLNFERLGIKTYKLSEYQQALDDATNGVVSKAVFQL